MFEFRNVKYKDVVDIPDLYIEEGLTVLLGASGSGKTTVLRMLNKMISPTEGEILFHGAGMRQIPSVKHRRKVVMLSQAPAMFEGNIRDNLTIACRFQEKDIPDDNGFREILSKVHLNKEPETPVNILSGGEKQRLALGRVLLLDPEIYLLDEPSSALDDDTEDTIVEMLSNLVKSTGRSIIMVTHSKAVAEKYADTLIEMADGKVINRRKK